jgi:hypothetical protein
MYLSLTSQPQAETAAANAAQFSSFVPPRVHE